MPLVGLSHITLRFGGTTILDDVTLAVEPGQRIGVIGQNGAGKSTLLALLAGQLAPSDGNVATSKNVTVAFQAQELHIAPGSTVRDHMDALFIEDRQRARQLEELEAQLAADPSPDDTRRLLSEHERLREHHEAAGGYDVDRRIETVLSSLGLAQDAWDQPLDQFSGGERNIVGLAGVLLGRPDVMLLDEPSNHLDIEGIEWFTAFLKSTPAAVVMVSHDRQLLDETVNTIWEVRKGGVTVWTGNYTAYREQREKALELQERQFKSQQRTIERLAFQARRLKDMANAYDDPAQAKRAKSMERRIERMDKVDRPDRQENRFHASLKGARRHGRLALEVRDYSFGFGDRVLFDGAQLTLEYGERVCLVGPNGSGKTTLFRAILDEGNWDHPTLRLGKSVRVGEYRQLHDVLDHDASLLDWTMQVTGLARTPASALLHRFLFDREDLQRSIGTLSGGEKSRLQLARLVHEQVNFLFLDEPTNHLDLQACEQLEEMLAEFEGTLFVISHDRRFLDSTVNRVVELRDQGLHLFRGSFSQWWSDKKEARERRRKSALELHSRATAHDPEAEALKETRELRRARRKERRRLEKSAAQAEGKIETLDAQRVDVLAQMQHAFADGADPTEGRRLAAELETLDGNLKTWMDTWERTLAALEEIGDE